MIQGKNHHDRELYHLPPGTDKPQNSHDPSLPKCHLEAGGIAAQSCCTHLNRPSHHPGGYFRCCPPSIPIVDPAALRFFTADGGSPPGACISAENETIPVYHFDKFVKHSAILGQGAAEERYLRYSLQNHFQNVQLWPSESSSEIEACKPYPENPRPKRHSPCNWKARFSLLH